ncbi:MAG: hypothetical protein AAF485_20745 [Chloroflexota bacterium]
MAISKKDSRNIQVDGHYFKWRATGGDGWINIFVWPTDNDNAIAIAEVDYHHDRRKDGEDRISNSQIIVTNRMIRALILHIGVKRLIENQGQIDVGLIEAFYDVSKAVRNGRSLLNNK